MRYTVVVGAGSLRAVDAPAVFAHRWSETGVSVQGDFTGAHLLHLAVAGCVLNDVYREAVAAGLVLAGVRVSSEGGFDQETWSSTGIGYTVELDTSASAQEQEALLRQVDEVAEIPRAVRAGAPVTRQR